ncbi:MAG: hypothetical protein ACP5NW_02945 [Candidatus Woesearchaeota archaeon]
MAWFNIFWKNRVDAEILDLYLEIELLTQEISKIFDDYIHHLVASEYYKSNTKDKKFYSIQKINYFFRKLKEDFAYCYTLRKNQKHYNFHKSDVAEAEKMEIEIALKKILNLLNNIYDSVRALDKSKIYSNDFSSLLKFVDETIKKDEELEEDVRILKKIKQKDEPEIFNVINKIVAEADKNARNKIYIISQKDKRTPLLFSQNLSIGEIKYLELVPLLELEGLEKRSLFINELHKDDTLPMFHYNLNIDGKNIHVIPRNYKERVKSFLSAA